MENKKRLVGIDGFVRVFLVGVVFILLIYAVSLMVYLFEFLKEVGIDEIHLFTISLFVLTVIIAFIISIVGVEIE